MSAYDLITIGRTGVDIYPLDHGVGLADVKTFEKFLGGSATNVAVAAARYGHRSSIITRTGRDPFGDYVAREMRDLGVDDVFVEQVDGPPTPVTFCEIFPPDRFPLYFYRYPVAPDLLIEPDSLPLDAIRATKVYWSTLTGLSQEPSRAAHFRAWEARARRRHTVLDLDWRPVFWADPEDGRAQAAAALEQVLGGDVAGDERVGRERHEHEGQQQADARRLDLDGPRHVDSSAPGGRALAQEDREPGRPGQPGQQQGHPGGAPLGQALLPHPATHE